MSAEDANAAAPAAEEQANDIDAQQDMNQQDDVAAHLGQDNQQEDEPVEENREENQGENNTEGAGGEDIPEAMKEGTDAHTPQQHGDGEGVRIFLGGISPYTTQEAIEAVLSEHCSVIKVDIPRDRETGAQKAFAFATVASEADAEKIIGKTFEIDGRTVDAKPSRRRGEGPQANAGGAQPRKIFIGGVPPGISEELYREHFGQYGEIETVEIPQERQGERPRGFAFVTYTTVEGAEKCRNGGRFQEFQGKNVEVKDATPRTAMGPGRGRGGAYGQGGYGMGWNPGMMGYGMMGYGMQAPVMGMYGAGYGGGMYGGGMYGGYGYADPSAAYGVGAGYGAAAAAPQAGGRYHPYGGGKGGSSGGGGGAGGKAGGGQEQWYSGRR